MTFLHSVKNLPLKWKLVLWSSFTLFLFFTLFAFVQYFLLKNWMSGYEQQLMKDKMTEIQAYFSEKDITSSEDIQRNKSFLEKVNEKNELIRVFDSKGNIILSITQKVPEDILSSYPIDKVGPQFVKASHSSFLVYKQSFDNKKYNGSVEIVKNLNGLNQFVELMLIILAVTGVLAIILSTAGGLLISKQLLIPLKTITTTMRNINKNGLTSRVPVYDTHDEISELTNIFNEMMDALENAFKKQKQFVEDASHELRTPIAVLEGHLSMLQRWGKKDPQILEESIDLSLQETKRLKDLVLELLELSRMDNEQERSYDLAFDPEEIIEKSIKNFSILYPNVSFPFQKKGPSSQHIFMQKRHFEQLLVILFDNAIKYSSTKKNITVEVKTEIQKKFYFIQIIDHGEGISREHLPFVFDRFYRVDKARSRERGGNGLGLSIAKQIISLYKGKVDIESEINEGTIVSLWIPLHP